MRACDVRRTAAADARWSWCFSRPAPTRAPVYARYERCAAGEGAVCAARTVAGCRRRPPSRHACGGTAPAVLPSTTSVNEQPQPQRAPTRPRYSVPGVAVDARPRVGCGVPGAQGTAAQRWPRRPALRTSGQWRQRQDAQQRGGLNAQTHLSGGHGATGGAGRRWTGAAADAGARLTGDRRRVASGGGWPRPLRSRRRLTAGRSTSSLRAAMIASASVASPFRKIDSANRVWRGADRAPGRKCQGQGSGTAPSQGLSTHRRFHHDR